MIIVTSILLTILIYMTVKVCKLVWPNEKAVPSMLVTLCTTLVSCIVYFLFLIESSNHPAWCCEITSSCVCWTSTTASLPAFFLAIAVILNLNVWVYFKLRTNALIAMGVGEEKNKKRKNGGMGDESEKGLMSTEARNDQDSHSNGSDESVAIDLIEDENKKLQKRAKISNIACTVLAGTYTFITLNLTVWPCIANEK